jgi:hypothetical protein
MSASDWSTGTQYSTLAGSNLPVLHGTVGTEYTTLKGSYTASDNADAWFLQGSVDLQDDTEYTIDAFRIFRKAEDPVTRDFQLSLNGNEYGEGGTLNPGERQNFPVAPETITNEQGQLRFQAKVGGNQQAMARLIFEAPLLFGRNGQFRVEESQGNQARITLLRAASQFSNQFKLLPFARRSGPFSVEPGTALRSDSGRRHAELTIQEGETTIEITYGN